MGTITNSNNKNNNFDCDDDNIENKKCFYCYKHIFNKDKNSIEFNNNILNITDGNLNNENNNDKNNIFYLIKNSLIKDNFYNIKYCNSIKNSYKKKKIIFKGKNFTETNNFIFDSNKLKKIIKLQKKIKSFLKLKQQSKIVPKKTFFRKNENKSSNDVSKYNILKEEEEIENLYKEFKVNNESEGNFSEKKYKISKNSNKSVNFNFIPAFSNHQLHLKKKQSSKFHYNGRNSKNSLLYSKYLQEKSDSLLDPNQIKGYFLKKKKRFKFIGTHNKETNQKEGFGKIIWEDDSILKANFYESKIDEIGVFYDKPSNSTFKGYYYNNIPNGYGIYAFNFELHAEGNFIKNKLNGIGIEFWEEGYYYQGYFKENFKDKVGLYRWPDGTMYMGEWRENKMNGIGIMKYQNDNIYEGEFNDGMMEGFGVFKWFDERIYVGNYKNDKKHGFGIFVWNFEPLNVFAGFWENGKQNGVGVKIDENKYEKFVLWKEGRKPIYLNGVSEIKEYLNNEQIKYKKFFNMNLMQKIRFFNSLKKIKENLGNLEIINYIDYDEAETEYEL